MRNEITEVKMLLGLFFFSKVQGEKVLHLSLHHDFSAALASFLQLDIWVK